MFLFNRKKDKNQPNKKGLPEKLRNLQKSDDIAWVWDPEYKMLVWANDKGMKFWEAETKHELRELIFPETHPLVQISDRAIQETKSNRVFLERLTLKRHPVEENFQCLFEKQLLMNGRNGVLVRIPFEPSRPSDMDIDDHEDVLIVGPETLEETSQEVSGEALSEVAAENDALMILENADIEDQEIEILPVSDNVPAEPIEISSDNLSDNLDDAAQDVITPEDEIQENEDLAEENTKDNEVADHEAAPMIVRSVDMIKDDLYQIPILCTLDAAKKIQRLSDNVTQDMEISKGMPFYDLFIHKNEADEALSQINKGQDLSKTFILNLFGQEMACLVQSEAVTSVDNISCNIAILRVTLDQYFSDQKVHLPISESELQEDLSAIEADIDIDDIVDAPDAPIETKAISPIIPDAKAEEVALLKNETIDPNNPLDNNNDIGILLVNRDGDINDVNILFSAMVGAGQSDILGKNITSFFDEETSDVIKNALQNPSLHLEDFTKGIDCEYISQKQPVNKGHLIIRQHPKQDKFWFLLDDLCLVNSLKDKISHLTAEEEAENNQPLETEKPLPTETLDDLASTKDSDLLVPDFLSYISHQLRSPLGAISGYMQLIQSQVHGELPEGYKKYLESMDISCQHAIEIIDNILQYSAIERDHFSNNEQETNIEEVFGFVKKLMAPQAKFNNVEILSKILGDQPKIITDTHLLKQIINNILSNAVKYAAKDSVIYMVAGLTKTNRLMIEITNFGKGMTPKQLELAMQPYKRLADKAFIRGTGLGLPLAKKLTELSGGYFFIESIADDRTRVRVIYDKDKVVFPAAPNIADK